MKICSKCKQELPLENFGKKNSGNQPYCRPCMREHSRAYYAANKDAQKARVVERNRRYRKQLRELMMSLKHEKPCLDCGVAYPWYVMDFDHITEGKLYNISDMVANLCSKEKLLNEINKCELVCANCHRLRTFSRRPDVLDVFLV